MKLGRYYLSMNGLRHLCLIFPLVFIPFLLSLFSGTLTNGQNITGHQYFRGPMDCLRTIIREKGLAGCYRGLISMCYRDIPSFGLYVASYEYLFQYLQGSRYVDSQGIVASLLAGGVAGTLTWSSIIPCDNVKSLLQADMTHTRYTGVWDCVVKTYSARGIRAFFTGLPICALRAFPVNALTFLVYSQLLKVMHIKE